MNLVKVLSVTTVTDTATFQPCQLVSMIIPLEIMCDTTAREGMDDLGERFASELFDQLANFKKDN